MNKTNLKPLRVADGRESEYPAKKMTHKCPFCGAELDIERMTTKAYAYHYDARCQDQENTYDK